MASITPAAVQNENLHVPRGKGVQGSDVGVIQNENLHILKGKAVDDGAKSSIMQNKNLHILKGKGVVGVKAEVAKPGKAGHQERKALRDLSQARKPVLSAANKATSLKEKSTAAIRETAKKPNANKATSLKEKSTAAIRETSAAKKAASLKEKSTAPIRETAKTPKSNTLTDEEMAKCREWAKEGIEHMHFTGNDMRKFEARQQEERVKRKVDKAMSALREWTDLTFGLDIPVKEVPSDTEDTLQLKFEPEVLPPTPTRARLPKKSVYEELDELLLELDYDSMYFDRQIELKLKEEECEGDADSVSYFVLSE